MWRKIRRIPSDTFRDLYILLKTGINARKSRGAKARLQNWTSFFKLDNASLILETDVLPPDLIDKSTGKPVLGTQMKKYKVIFWHLFLFSTIYEGHGMCPMESF